MHGMTIHEAIVPGLAIAPQAIGTTPVTGTTISLPWEQARKLTFFGIGGALVAADALTVKVQARRKGTSTWDDVQDNTGAADLTFTVSKLSDTGAIENGAVIGTVDLGRLRTGTGGNLPPVSSVQYEYDALRLNAVNANNTTPGIVGFGYMLWDLFQKPSTTVDDLLFSQTPQVDD